MKRSVAKRGAVKRGRREPENGWLEREAPVAEIEQLLARLERRGVRYVFPHLIPFDAQGRLPPHSRPQMRAFLEAARRVAPGMKVLPWIGGLRLGWRRQLRGQLALGDLAQRQQIVAECRGLVDEGFDGIHVNVEPVDSGNVEFLALLRALRTGRLAGAGLASQLQEGAAPLARIVVTGITS